MVDALILNYNDYNSTRELALKYASYSSVRKVLIVDNKSTNDSFNQLRMISSDKIVVLETDNNGGYGYGNNYGIKYLYQKCNSKYILLSNPDVLVSNDTICELETLIRNSDYSFVAPWMLNKEGVKQNNTAYKLPQKWQYLFSFELLFKKFNQPFSYKGLNRNNKKVLQVDGLAGSLFLMNTEDFLRIGLFDENIFLYCEELVLALKAKNNNLKMALLTSENYYHLHSTSIDTSFSKPIQKQKLLNNSKIYVLKNYYNANIFELILGKLLCVVSLMEVVASSFMKTYIKKDGIYGQRH